MLRPVLGGAGHCQEMPRFFACDVDAEFFACDVPSFLHIWPE